MKYEEHHHALIEYLKSKVAIADWHGVSDAANDLRVLEAQHQAENFHGTTKGFRSIES